jgi:hypothetical protein
MSIDLCEHGLPIRVCEICREAADLLGKGDNVLISRAYLTEWVREAHKYQETVKKLEALENENAALRLDAHRYWWLRSYNAFAVTEKDGEGGYTLMGDEYLDAAIDDEMGKEVK